VSITTANMINITDTYYCGSISDDEEQMMKEIINRNKDAYISSFAMDNYWRSVDGTRDMYTRSVGDKLTNTILHAIRNGYDVDSLFTPQNAEMSEEEMLNMIENTETDGKMDSNEPGVPYHGLTGKEMTKEEWDELMKEFKVTITDEQSCDPRSEAVYDRDSMQTTARMWYGKGIISTELFNAIVEESELIISNAD
jgi:hypothetical protein